MPRATSMMVFGRGGQNTILVATMLSFRLVKRLTAGSVHVQLERVTVRVLHVDRGAAALADHWDAGRLQPLAQRGKSTGRNVNAKVVEATGLGVDGLLDLDEVQQIAAASALEEEHAAVLVGLAQPEVLHVEPFGRLQIAGPEG